MTTTSFTVLDAIYSTNCYYEGTLYRMYMRRFHHITNLFSIQRVISLNLMMEVTKPGPLPAPILCKTIQKSHFLSTTLPMDCVVNIRSTDTIKE